VALYNKLLAENACDQWDDLSDDHFVQGAIQLALARHTANFLPEVIGFNLGYEQLPLHLPITAYELNELGIDPYYFTLHVTIDNAATGHAMKAIEALRLAMPVVDDGGEFYRRVLNGYMLNDLGQGTTSVIASFDLEKELIGILQRKSVVGKHAHSDYCKVAGRSVSEWLTSPALIPDFLAALERNGWIRRNQDPANSRFWQLLQGDRADMFGVFNDYELQVIHDWIAGCAASPDIALRAPGSAGHPALARQRLTFRARQRLLGDIDKSSHEGPLPMSSSEAQFYQRSEKEGDDFDTGTRLLEAKLAGLCTRQERMDALVPLMAPALHSRPEGLLATRLFAEAFASRY
jgi:hypothetical protein